MADALRTHSELVESLAGRGLLSSEWREVWEQLPRHLFIPPQTWRQGPQRCEPVATDADWWQLVYSDEPVVTQVDDGQDDGPGIATSSNSMPSMVASTLQLLDVRYGDRVLEIGTGTGHVAALLCERLGDALVFSVEIDPRLTEQAKANLAAVGHEPTLIQADGEHGWPKAAPYDRLVSTCALRRVPYELVRQLKPGGILVAPIARDFWSGALVKLTVQEDGTASGRFQRGASYMPLKSHRPTAAPPVDQGSARSTDSTLDPRKLLTLGFALYGGARMPGVMMVHAEQGGRDRVWLMDRDGSGAIADAGEPVWQYGPRSLWTEAEAAYAEYVDLGEPEAHAFGLTVTPDREQVWMHTPDAAITPSM